MTLDKLNELKTKRIIDMTGAEFLALTQLAKNEDEIELEYVDRETKNKILYCRTTKSDSRANGIINWGKQNGFPVRKSGGSNWHRVDLKNLSEAYWDSHRDKKKF